MKTLKQKIVKKISQWLAKPILKDEILSPNDFRCVRDGICSGDVLLIEGRTRIGHIIKVITRSSWSHACICIGSLEDIKDEKTRAIVREHYDGDASIPLIVESEINRGTIVAAVDAYADHHMRICRPVGLLSKDADTITRYVVSCLGNEYNLHQLLDLGRFLIPWWVIIPRRWHSTLFEHNAGETTRTICSSMIASAFQLVKFPILPLIESSDDDGNIRMVARNPNIFTPRDFDYSPFFSVIKCPYFSGNDEGYYHHLPWAEARKNEEWKEGEKYLEASDIIHVKRKASRAPPIKPAKGKTPNA